MRIIGEIENVVIVEIEGSIYQRISTSGTVIFWRKSFMTKINQRSRTAIKACQIKKEEIKSQIVEFKNGFFFRHFGMTYFRNNQGETKALIPGENSSEDNIGEFEMEFQSLEEELLATAM